MAATMAAALAASLPAPTAAPAPAAAAYETIPASMVKAIDLEAETPITTVQLDGLVCPAHVIPSSSVSFSCLGGHKNPQARA